MFAKTLPNGNLLIPVRLEGDDGLIGEGMEEITPEDERFEEWKDWTEDNGLRG